MKGSFYSVESGRGTLSINKIILRKSASGSELVEREARPRPPTPPNGSSRLWYRKQRLDSQVSIPETIGEFRLTLRNLFASLYSSLVSKYGSMI
ncbi:hypothetical protein Y032_0059g2996 [Ancylostoma ceylanicum]|uniref:Uncharacterized protein n=1 Tax=Ancylostoma ceylanicum TaxID=53326 RepID=A0A016U3H5_9BILA|nr:hypothetical protein Y032_0059g2996 [Ancylostoma ceylanicum]